MNYLDLVNNVLKRLRQNEVTAVAENTYSNMVGAFVNDARKFVEDAWEWNCLKTTFTVPTVAGTQEYTLSDSDNRVRILDAQNITSQLHLTHISQQEGRHWNMMNGTTQSDPTMFYTSGLQSSGVYAGDNQISLVPIPDGVYSLRFECVLREADLVAEGDTTNLPAHPIIYWAWAYAAQERGDVGGTGSSELFGMAKKALSDAISRDAELNPQDLVWRDEYYR